jgi:hypothetical protein
MEEAVRPDICDHRRNGTGDNRASSPLAVGRRHATDHPPRQTVQRGCWSANFEIPKHGNGGQMLDLTTPTRAGPCGILGKLFLVPCAKNNRVKATSASYFRHLLLRRFRRVAHKTVGDRLAIGTLALEPTPRPVLIDHEDRAVPIAKTTRGKRPH